MRSQKGRRGRIIRRNDYLKMIMDPYFERDESCEVATTDKKKLEGMQNARLKSALTNALEIRKFEIDMYWKRATYFWTFISLVYGAYFYTLEKIAEFHFQVALCPLACVPEEFFLGLIFFAMLGMLASLLWSWVSLGSKFWQDNWERQVDALEGMVHGPLYRTAFFSSRNWWNHCTDKSPLSVSKINLAITLIFFSVSVVLTSYSFYLWHPTQLENIICLLVLSVLMVLISIFGISMRNLESSVFKQYRESFVQTVPFKVIAI